jgi:hypothetical protein
MSSLVSVLLVLIGVGQIVLGVGHVGLPRVLGWKTDLAGTSAMTRSVSYVHTLFIGFVTALFGFIDVVYRNDLLVDPRLGRLLAASIAIFWGLRAGAQVFWFAVETRKLPYGSLLQFVAICAWLTLTIVNAAALVLNVN